MTQTSASDEEWFKRLEEKGLLLDNLSSLGWALWAYHKDGSSTGYFDEVSLRKLADEIERRNKPFWDEYNAYCEQQSELPLEEEDFVFDTDGPTLGG